MNPPDALPVSLRIAVNGEPRTCAAGTTVAALLGQLGVAGRPIAVELNQELLPRDRFDRILRDGDRLEVVTFVGGG